MKRLIAIWVLCFSLAACTAPGRTLFSPLSDPDQSLFIKGLEELNTQDASPTLSALANRPEPSPWRQRARTLLDWQTRVQDREQSRASSFQNQLRACRISNDKLTQENAALSHDLQELKRIMVEMEKRGK
jgi:cytochrome c-type biogenesis protein CcmH/NrfF